MSNIIINNAYRLLGLLPNVTTKDISKRIKNFDKLLQIGNIPDFDFDFNYYCQLRTKENIDILKNVLFNPKEQILHYFFSIYLQSDKQINEMKEIESDFTLDKIYEYYNNRSDLISSKNSAILMYLYLYVNKDIKNEKIRKLVTDNISLWYEIIFFNSYYQKFKALYAVDDEIGISESLLDTIQEEFQKELIKAYSELVEVRNEPEILAELVNVFELKDSNITIQQVEDCYKNIDNAIEILDSMNISEDGIFDDDEKRTLKESLMIVQNNLNTLMDYDLYDDSRTIVLRDRIVRIVRNQMIDLHNNLLERETALNLVDFALEICGTEGLRLTLEEERNVIQNNINSESFDDILKQIKNKFDKAKAQMQFLTKSDIKILSSDVANLYDKLSVKDSELSDIIFYFFRNLSVDMSNKYDRYSEALLLLKMGYVYAKTNEAQKKYSNDVSVLTRIINTRNENRYGCLYEIFARIIVFGIICLVVAACDSMG